MTEVTWVRALRLAVGGVMLAMAAYFVLVSWRWELLCDSPIMHYVNFLMDHGMKPYSQITDNNFPGSYMAESLAMRVFGPGDVAWRVYEFFLLGVMTAAMVVIAWPVDWVAGVFAGGMFLSLHAREGPWLSVEREEVITVLLLVGYAAMFSSVRQRRPWMMILLGFAGAWAGAMKPTMSPLVVILVVVAWRVLRRRGERVGAYVAWAVAGIALATLLNVGFLVRHHAVADFIYTQRVISPYYAGLKRMPLRPLLRQTFSLSTMLLALAAGVLAFERKGWDWERWTLVLAVAIGFVSYVTQGKGFWHHKYVMVSFLFVLIGLEVFRALKRPGWARCVAVAALAFAMLFVIPRDARVLHKQKGTSDLTTAMEADLVKLAGPAGVAGLQGRVQCLDLVYGCLNSLYHLGLVENTGFTGDMLVFAPTDEPAVRYHRAMWAEAARRDPAEVLVMTNQYFQGENRFDKVNNWPEYARYLAANYIEVVERKFPYEYAYSLQRDSVFGGQNAYRIYVLKGSPVGREARGLLGAGNFGAR